MKYFRVKNFDKYQPKRNGKNAPWIRLYHGWNLDAKVGNLHDSHKSHWIGILSMAHTEDNRVPFNNKWVKKRGLFGSPVKLEMFVELGLIEILDDKACKDVVRETLGEKEKEKGEKKKNIYSEEVEKAFEEDWLSYPRKAGDKVKAKSCYAKSVGNNLKTNRPRFQEKMKEYVESEDDLGYLKYGETFFRNWENIEVCNIKPVKFETFQEKQDREMREAKERINANNT